MTHVTLADLQASVIDTAAFDNLTDYFTICHTFLTLLEETQPTRIISPTDHNYIFYQYGERFGHKITRPLNSDLFFGSADNFKIGFERFTTFLADIRKLQAGVNEQPTQRGYLDTNEVNGVIYTIQQSVGSIGDSFDNPNQSRKRVGQLFETLVKLIIAEATAFSASTQPSRAITSWATPWH